jgi:molybdate transport system substrate-binding protein
MIVRILALCCSLLLLAQAAVAGEVSVAAAASLKEVVGELADRFARQQPGVRVIRNFGGSGILAKQIENGAPTDVFIAANQEWIDYLAARKLVDTASIGTFAHNSLVFVGSRPVSGLADLPSLGRIAIGNPKSVPAGEYAQEALRRAGLAKQLEKRLVMARDVREALLYAERGDVDGAFVYRTDALLTKQARQQFVVPQGLYPRIAYPVCLTIKGAGNSDAARFLAFLGSAEARSLLQKFGFEVR